MLPCLQVMPLGPAPVEGLMPASLGQEHMTLVIFKKITHILSVIIVTFIVELYVELYVLQISWVIPTFIFVLIHWIDSSSLPRLVLQELQPNSGAYNSPVLLRWALTRKPYRRDLHFMIDSPAPMFYVLRVLRFGAEKVVLDFACPSLQIVCRSRKALIYKKIAFGWVMRFFID